MGKLFEDISHASLSCQGVYQKEPFTKIKPFTSDCLTSVIDKMDLNDGPLLSYGSSGDEIINFNLYGSNNQIINDECEFTKYFFYLKKAALMTLTYDEYISFFDNSYLNITDIRECDVNFFNKNLFKRIQPCLKTENYESYVFWTDLFNKYDSLNINNHIFSQNNANIKENNPYLQDSKSYQQAATTIVDCYPIFNKDNVLSSNLDLETIYLSNIDKGLSKMETLELIKKYISKLSTDGHLYQYIDNNVENKQLLVYKKYCG